MGNSVPAIARIGRVDVPAESAQRRAGGRLFGRDHLLQHNARQRKLAGAVCEPIEQTLGVDREIVGGAEESRMTRHASHAPRGWIVHDATKASRRQEKFSMPAGRDEMGSCSYSVGAMLGIHEAGGRNCVCDRPSGSMMLRFVYSSRVRPESFSTIAPSAMKLMSLVDKLLAGRTHGCNRKRAPVAFLFALPGFIERQVRRQA